MFFGGALATEIDLYKVARAIRESLLVVYADSRMRFAFPYVDAIPPEILTHAFNPYCELRLFQATLGALPPSASIDVGYGDWVDTLQQRHIAYHSSTPVSLILFLLL